MASKAAYNLDEVRRLALSRKLLVSKRPTVFIKNRYAGKPVDTILEVIKAITENDFYKSVELNKLPGTMADIYAPYWDETRWYVKLFINEDKLVCVWSCNWDGCEH